MSDKGSDDDKFVSALPSRNESLDHCSTQLPATAGTSDEALTVLFPPTPATGTSRQDSFQTALDGQRAEEQTRASTLSPRPEHTILCSLVCQGKPEDCV